MRSSEISREYQSQETEDQENNIVKAPQPVSRRRFLKTAAGAAAGLSLATNLSAEQEVNPEQQEREEFKDAWIKFKNIIETENVRDNFKYSKKEFGSSTELTTKVEADLQIFDQLLDQEKKGVDIINDPNTRGLRRDLKTRYDLFWNRENIRSRGHRNRSQDVIFENFDRLPGVNAEELKKRLEAVYGSEWVYGSVDKVVYSKESKIDPKNMVAQATGRTLTTMLTKRNDQVIYLHEESIKSPEDSFQILAHEFAHYNDWIASHNLTFAERLQFAREVSERFYAPDRPRYQQMVHTVSQRIKEKDLSKEHKNLYQAYEHWGMLVQNHAVSPREFRQNHPKDYELVEKWRNRINNLKAA